MKSLRYDLIAVNGKRLRCELVAKDHSSFTLRALSRGTISQVMELCSPYVGDGCRVRLKWTDFPYLNVELC